MKIMVRECPFDTDPVGSSWSALHCTPEQEGRDVNPVLVKSFDIAQSDKEVYTVFFSYLNGYPIQEDKILMIAVHEASGEDMKAFPGIKIDEEKFGIYGYRPLFVHFIGYSYDPKRPDLDTSKHLQDMNERLQNWYANLDRMYSGSITMATDLKQDMPQPGERVRFLGGEFYVVDSEHRWNYGGNPETVISISRGGDYKSGKFAELRDVAKRYQELNYTKTAAAG
jgi:hypothetical protein